MNWAEFVANIPPASELFYRAGLYLASVLILLCAGLIMRDLWKIRRERRARTTTTTPPAVDALVEPLRRLRRIDRTPAVPPAEIEPTSGGLMQTMIPPLPATLTPTISPETTPARPSGYEQPMMTVWACAEGLAECRTYVRSERRYASRLTVRRTSYAGDDPRLRSVVTDVGTRYPEGATIAEAHDEAVRVAQRRLVPTTSPMMRVPLEAFLLDAAGNPRASTVDIQLPADRRRVESIAVPTNPRVIPPGSASVAELDRLFTRMVLGAAEAPRPSVDPPTRVLPVPDPRLITSRPDETDRALSRNVSRARFDAWYERAQAIPLTEATRRDQSRPVPDSLTSLRWHHTHAFNGRAYEVYACVTDESTCWFAEIRVDLPAPLNDVVDYRRFTKATWQYGVPDHGLAHVYQMAKTVAALAYPPVGVGEPVDVVTLPSSPMSITSTPAPSPQPQTHTTPLGEDRIIRRRRPT